MPPTEDPVPNSSIRRERSGDAPTISVFIMTKNEANNLPGCLESVAWSDDIHVLDSFSDDDTTSIAERFGAIVSYRKFDSFSQQQNWALQNLPFKHPWLFYIDADERATPELVKSMTEATRAANGVVAYHVRRRDFFMQRWLKHVQPTSLYLRLFQPSKMQYERLGHAVSKPDGPVGHITGYLDHYPFSKGMADWYQKHNFYSTQEAQQFLAERGANTFSLKLMLFGENLQVKRRQMKTLFYRMPMRPIVKFCWMYFLKGGFLDGYPGFTYAVLVGFYEHMIALKVRELIKPV